MKKLYSLMISALLISCSNVIEKPRIGIAGIAIESSSFSPARTTINDFDIKTNEDIFSSYSFFNDNYENKAKWFPTMRARALPGGIVTRESYEIMVNQILEMTKKTLP